MPDARDILQYYISDEFKPTLPEDTCFRHFRFKTADGGWKKVKIKINSKDELLRWIVKLGGTDLYYSTAKWMDPTQISSKTGKNVPGMYHVANNLLLGSDLVFDIDADEPITIKTLEVSRKSAHNIYEAMKNHKDEYELVYAAFTGYKGFRLSYKDKSLDLPNNPRARLDFLENKRKIFIEQLLGELQTAKGPNFYKVPVKFDKPITLNPMCVIRVIGTVHSSTGFISQKINVSDLKKPVIKILDSIQYIGKRRPVIPKTLREMKKGGLEKSPRPRLLSLAKDVPGLASLPFNYFITNRVLGVRKSFVPIFIYQNTCKYYLSEVKKIQQKHNLGHLYVFEGDNQKVVISLKTMQRRQMQKVLNESSSRVKHDFMKYKRILAPFVLKFEQKIKGKVTGHLSRGHKGFVSPDKTPTPGLYTGWPKIELIRANKEEF